jgi:oligopeptide/dipeptide ABC transporter ATP-binding protein
MGTDRSRPLAVIPGRPADPANLPAGCAFAPRCALATDLCRSTEPELVADPAGRRVACWQAGEVPGAPAEPVLSRVGDEP